MILFYILLVILIVSRLQFQPKGYYSDYLSFDTTNAIKGIFIALVFIMHITPYIINSGYSFDNSFFNKLFLFINAHVGQWIVAMFLFYSGYGVMESIRKKGKDYVTTIPGKRVLTTLVNFDIAVALFAVISIFTTNNYTIKDYLFSFIGWESVGNSNWYIFVIMLCYLITYISFQKNADNIYKCCLRCLTLLLISVIALSFLKPTWWYDTMLCFGLGISYSILRERIESIIKRYYWLIVPILLLLLVCLGKIPYSIKGLVYNAYCMVFCLLIITLSMKIKINNSLLIWSGKNLFPLYIYQRVPMIILSSIYGGTFISSYPVLYTAVCLLITLLFAYFYKYWAVKL